MVLDEIALKISNYLLDSPEYPLISTPPDIETRLIDNGYIDSFGILNLIGFIEEFFDIELDEDDIDAENFSTVSEIANLIFKSINQ